MKRTAKNTGALLLALCTVLLSSAACGENAGEPLSSGAPAQETAAETEAAFVPADYLPEADYGGKEFHILTAAEQWYSTYESEQTGDVLNDAVYDRNRTVEERFNTDLCYDCFNGYSAGMSSVKTALTESVLSGTAEYDLVVADGYYVSNYVFDNLLSPLDDFIAFDFTREHWLTDTINEHRLAGKAYFAVGYLSVNTMRQTIILFWNKKISEQYDLGNFYDLVLDGKWTKDKMKELALEATADTDGDTTMTENDCWGVISSAVDAIGPMQTAMGHKYTSSADGSFVMRPLDERLVGINDFLYEMLNGKNYTFLLNSEVAKMTAMFAADKGLFLLYRLDMSETEDIRNMDNYGFLPLPKYDEAQEDYTGAGGCDVAAIPTLVDDAEMSSVLCDAIAAYGYYDVLPVYYDVVLTTKYARDENSVKMLDIIVKNIYTDPAMTFSGLCNNIYYSIGKKNIASSYEKTLSGITKNIDKALANLG